MRDEDGVVTVVRSCVDTCAEERYSAFGISTETFCCNDRDACNGARTQAALIDLPLVLLATAAVVVELIFQSLSSQ